jgi:hypothetical protein
MKKIWLNDVVGRERLILENGNFMRPSLAIVGSYLREQVNVICAYFEFELTSCAKWFFSLLK